MSVHLNVPDTPGMPLSGEHSPLRMQTITLVQYFCVWAFNFSEGILPHSPLLEDELCLRIKLEELDPTCAAPHH